MEKNALLRGFGIVNIFAFCRASFDTLCSMEVRETNQAKYSHVEIKKTRASLFLHPLQREK